MATRIVEQNLRWCEDKIVEFLTQNGYAVATVGSKERKIQGRYTRTDRKRMLLVPQIEITMAPISNRTTHVRVWFRQNLLVFMLVFFAYLVIGFAPFPIMLRVVSQRFDMRTLWIILCWIATGSWMIYFLVIRLTLAVGRLSDHQIKTEERLWQHLDIGNLYSHKIDSASPLFRRIFSVCTWASFCMMIMGIVSFREAFISLPETSYMLLILPTFLFVMCGLTNCSLALPHRYHWKLRFYYTYLLWGFIVTAPCMMIPCNGMDPAASSAFSTQNASVYLVIGLQVFMIPLAMRIFPEHRNGEKAENYYLPPSVRYEVLSEQDLTKDIRYLLKKQRLWTWMSFFLFTILFHVAAIYLAIVLIESTVGILGAKWALAKSSYWPLLINLKGKPAAIEAFLLTSFVGSPMLFSVVQTVRAYRKSQRTLALAEKHGLALAQAHLPKQPLEYMRDKVGMERIFVVDVPDPLVNLRLEKRGFLEKSYFLIVSLVARKTLSEREMEALLWHECGHIEFVGHTLRRDIAAILAPWGPRFLDLMEDLYEKEHGADLFAAQKMGSIRPLKSALMKINDQYKKLPKQRKRQERGIFHSRDGFDFLKIVWDLDWKGYLHPNIDQRLHWLEEWEANVRPVHAKGDL